MWPTTMCRRDDSWLQALLRAVLGRSAVSEGPLSSDHVWGGLILVGALVSKEVALRRQAPRDHDYDPPYLPVDVSFSLGGGLSFEDKHGHVP